MAYVKFNKLNLLNKFKTVHWKNQRSANGLFVQNQALANGEWSGCQRWGQRFANTPLAVGENAIFLNITICY
jgi:hypothetical protein